MPSPIAEILAHPAFQRATEHLRADHDRMVSELITLTEIPAPPFKEEKRAAAYLALLEEAGLEDCQTDEIGNVMGVLRGTGNGNFIAVAAHLDTVFPEGTDVTVRREGTKLMAPGVGDDTRGLAVNLSIIRAMKAAGIRPSRDILFVGDVGEEGKGDLRGVRHLFTKGAFRDRIEGFFSVDGLDTGRLAVTGVGSLRYRVVFSGPGGHSFMAFGLVNPAYAMAEVLAGLSAIATPKDPKTTVTPSVFGGGTSINAIPEEVWFELDLRSVSQTELARVDREFRALVDKAVAAENARASTASGEIRAEIRAIGDRPAGSNATGSPFVAGVASAVSAFGFTPALEASSTDANIPISLGIPALAIGSGGAGGRAHSLEEWIDVEPEASLRGMTAVMAAILTAAGIEG